MHEFNQSLKYDQRMHSADIRGSIAHAKSLHKGGIITADEEKKLIEGLQAVEKEWADGTVRVFFFEILNVFGTKNRRIVPSGNGR